jgi:hypothetical protein
VTFPRPPSLDPLITDHEAAGNDFSVPTLHPFESRCSFTASRYADFLMTESNVIAAVEYGGRSAEEIRGQLEKELTPLFGRESRAVVFSGYIQLLQRL